MEKKDMLYLNTTALAFLGDAVYETCVRERLVRSGQIHGDRLHRIAVGYVRAEAQAASLKRILPELTEEELALVKRGRNKRINSKPKHADPVIYKWATAFEALLGYLYLSGQEERLGEIMEEAMKHSGDRDGKKTGEK